MRMNYINALKKLLLNIFVPHIDGMPHMNTTKKKQKDLSQEQRFRDLFKKRKSALILVSVVLCIIVFGIEKSFSFITSLIVCSSFVVIFWSSFGEEIMNILKFKKKKE
tara:strand:+ start:68 stop:391 length:324 start_codon:yes stop_codon:yes gene_type:complete